MSMIINNVFISDEALIKALLYFPNKFFFTKSWHHFGINACDEYQLLETYDYLKCMMHL